MNKKVNKKKRETTNQECCPGKKSLKHCALFTGPILCVDTITEGDTQLNNIAASVIGIIGCSGVLTTAKCCEKTIVLRLHDGFQTFCNIVTRHL